MDTTKALEQIDRVLNLEGEPYDVGVNGEDPNAVEEMLHFCRSNYPHTPVSMVSNWCWADLDLNDEEREFLKDRMNKLGSFIYAQNIIFDEKRRWPSGSQVRTSLLVEFSQNCIFRTANTCYLLVGKGVRLKVDLSVFD